MFRRGLGEANMTRFAIACWLALATAAHGQDPFCKDLSYEHHNQVDYGPLSVSSVKGVVQDKDHVPIPQASVVIFTEADHRLVLSTCTGSDGHFDLKGIKPGAYRSVIKYEAFCAANAKIKIGYGVHFKNSLVAPMRPAGIDTCSWVELK